MTGVMIEILNKWYPPKDEKGQLIDVNSINLDPPAHLRGPAQRRYLDYLQRLNRAHLEARPGELDLEARIASYELAARMQTAAREALDLSRESPATRRLYGLDDAVTLPILRPLLGWDKTEIMAEARRIRTLAISELPDQDCCTLLTPRQVETRARIEDLRKIEARLDADDLAEELALAAQEHTPART